jgi:hypothetical protein
MQARSDTLPLSTPLRRCSGERTRLRADAYAAMGIAKHDAADDAGAFSRIPTAALVPAITLKMVRAPTGDDVAQPPPAVLVETETRYGNRPYRVG